MKFDFISIALFALVSLCAWHGDVRADDPFLWLEEIESTESMSWVRSHNASTASRLESDSRFSVIQEEVRKIALAKDRVPSVSHRGGYLYNLWQDEKNKQGLWRRTTLKSYQKSKATWEVLLDLDQLSAREGETWVWHGAECLPPEYVKCLLSLSPGGSDKAVIREFDVSSKSFVEGGFQVPVAKARISWVNEDEVLLGTDFGEGSLTESGYPMILKHWKRGAPLSDATEIFRGLPSDVAVGSSADFGPNGNWIFVSRSPSFFEEENFIWNATEGLKKIPFPQTASFKGIFRGHLLASLRESWTLGGKIFGAGSLVSLELKYATSPQSIAQNVKLVLAAEPRMSIESVSMTRNALYVTVLDNVKGKLLRLYPNQKGWSNRVLNYPKTGSLSLISADSQSDLILLSYEDFITPRTLYMQDIGKNGFDRAPLVLKQSPKRFDSSQMEVVQKEAKSKDGTLIPYFMIKKRGMSLDGSNPTLLYGYGGFEVPLTPDYHATWGKVWVEKGGVAVIANIRGGGEFGPDWHQAALKEKRQNAFDDFIAVAEDLIRTGVTSPRRLAIEGGSNGGLLVGAVFVQRPDLFQAVIDQVPLLDMMRYHKLLAGPSWVGEYGNPDVPEEAEYILKYSPYQNVKPGLSYPNVLFVTSTKDDRVHPGHARKMAAKMESFGYSIEYYENTDGGHGADANLEELVHRSALEFTFLFQRLVGERH